MAKSHTPERSVGQWLLIMLALVIPFVAVVMVVGFGLRQRRR